MRQVKGGMMFTEKVEPRGVTRHLTDDWYESLGKVIKAITPNGDDTSKLFIQQEIYLLLADMFNEEIAAGLPTINWSFEDAMNFVSSLTAYYLAIDDF
jgi:hypothetical protein